MRRMIGGSMVALMLVAISVGATAAHPSGARPHRGRAGAGLLAVLRSAGLTEDQRAQVRQILASHRPQFESLRAQMQLAREALGARLLGPDPVTAVDLAPLTQQLEQARAQLTHEGLQVWIEVRAILTPEQLARATQVSQRVRELRSEMRGLLGGR